MPLWVDVPIAVLVFVLGLTVVVVPLLWLAAAILKWGTGSPSRRGLSPRDKPFIFFYLGVLLVTAAFVPGLASTVSGIPVSALAEALAVLAAVFGVLFLTAQKRRKRR